MNRRIYLSVDGGGSKLVMLLFDEDFRVLGEGRSGGVNLNSTTLEDAEANITQCLDQVFGDAAPSVIDKLYYVFVGRAPLLINALERVCRVRETFHMSEPVAGLLAGALWRGGILALSGTGSDVFYIEDESSPPLLPQINREAQILKVVGGWGPILGDDGSGAWIGQRAIRAAIAGLEGWAEPTDILRLIKSEWHLKKDWDMVDIVYRSPFPYRLLGSLTKIVAKAARGNDNVAQDILREAGKLMATQTICLINRCAIKPADFRLVCAGGAWKAHSLMYETFAADLNESFPDLPVRKPCFEPVMAGPVQEILDSADTDGTESAEERLKELFPAYVIQI